MDNTVTNQSKHLLPELPYAYNALEPYLDSETMSLHHDKHHASYVDSLNSALEKFPELQERSALWLLLNLDKVPKRIRLKVRNNAGGHVNHSMFWHAMSPAGTGGPEGRLADAIEKDFGSVEKFKYRFEEAGTKVFGSGWVWLARSQRQDARLQIYTTAGHDNPLMKGHYPILLNDVWEHAYYLKYQNRRADYLKAWWDIVNWAEAANRYESPDSTAGHDPGAEGGPVPA